MNGVNNDWLPVEAEAYQRWPPKKGKKRQTNKTRKTEKEREKQNTLLYIKYQKKNTKTY